MCHVMEDVRQKGVDEGWNKGWEDCFEELNAAIRRLRDAMEADNRGDEFMSAAGDPQKQKMLFKKYGIVVERGRKS